VKSDFTTTNDTSLNDSAVIFENTSNNNSDGVTLLFKDADSSKKAHIHFPSDYRRTILNPNIPASTLIVGDHLMFGKEDPTDATYQISPTISGNSKYSLLIQAHTTDACGIIMKPSNTTYNYMKLDTLYYNHDYDTEGLGDESQTQLVHIGHGQSQTSSGSSWSGGVTTLTLDRRFAGINCDKLVLMQRRPYALNMQYVSSSSNGLQIDMNNINPVAGHVAFIKNIDSELTGNIGNLTTGFIIKPYSGGDGVSSEDPINTLYYTV
jgi:hypothetical protein